MKWYCLSANQHMKSYWLKRCSDSFLPIGRLNWRENKNSEWLMPHKNTVNLGVVSVEEAKKVVEALIYLEG